MKRRILPIVAGLLVLCAGAPRASLLSTITVNTYDDQDGVDAKHCSLREAVKAIGSLQPYGGCPAGNAFTDNRVQLQAGDYPLTLGELYVTNNLIIQGKDSEQEAHDEIADPLTGLKPRKFRPDYTDADTNVGFSGKTGTYIIATPGSRIFNGRAGLNVMDVVLVGSASSTQAVPTSVAGNGGVLFSTAAVSMRNVIVRGGGVSGTTLAAGNGGAIYMGGDNTSLVLTDVTLEDGHADNMGGAIAMLCSAGLNPYAQHSLTISRTLIRGNDSDLGAGAIDACGNTSLSISNSTLSANTSAAASGAVAYVQGAEVGLGQLTLSYVTAVEQVGHVLAANGLSTLTITGSLLARFTTSGATEVCFNPDAAIDWSAASPSGTYNAFDNDGSCAGIMSGGGSNVAMPLLTPLQDVLVPIRRPVDYYPAADNARAPFGLTDYYLPKIDPSSPILDKAQAFGECISTDQRGIDRRSGSACDIGAVERLKVTARDDVAESRLDTDRLAIVDLLANDSFGEDDITGPYKFAANTVDNPATTGIDETAPAVQLVDDGDGRCKWKMSDDPDYPGKLVVQNLDPDWLNATPRAEVPDGSLTTDDAPIICTYRVIDTVSTSPMVGTVKVQIKNQGPNAVNDSYLRPVGEPEVSFNPLDNDNDKGDGKFGLAKHSTPNPTPGLPDLVSYGPEVDWAPYYPIQIVSEPALGKVYGASSGLCPGSATVPKVCLNPPLRYVADNNLSPFTDTFSYQVYDSLGQNSGEGQVSIYTDAPDVDHGGGAGSLDALAGIVLGLLGLRRFRKL